MLIVRSFEFRVICAQCKDECKVLFFDSNDIRCYRDFTWVDMEEGWQESGYVIENALCVDCFKIYHGGL